MSESFPEVERGGEVRQPGPHVKRSVVHPPSLSARWRQRRRGRPARDALDSGRAFPSPPPASFPPRSRAGRAWSESADRKSTRLNSSTNAHLVCRLLLEKKKSKR